MTTSALTVLEAHGPGLSLDLGPLSGAGAGLGPTLDSPVLRRAQRRHAIAVVVGGALGVAGAVALVWARGWNAVDLALFGGFTLLIGSAHAIGFHRFFTHQCFKAGPGTRAVLAALGSMAAQGPVIFWAALHRRHHECSDAEGDPHSPHVDDRGRPHRSRWRGLWHAYQGWTYVHEVPNAVHYCRDLLRDRVVTRVNRQYFLWVALGLLLPALLGAWWQRSWWGLAGGFVWGGLLRVLFWHNMTWYITSGAHVFGTRDYESGDLSTNNAWMALPTLGEAWHNNHHAFPHAASFGFEWWQWDFCGLVVRALEACGLVRDVHRPSATARQARRRKGAWNLKEGRP